MSAVISPCGLYRYRLERDLGGLIAGPTVAWIMVNPSTADATADDATIRKVLGFSRRLGAGRVIVGNLFAFRATDIKALRTAADPVGLDADQHLRAIFEAAEEGEYQPQRHRVSPRLALTVRMRRLPFEFLPPSRMATL